ncbi:MAG TPA: M56 family metallopeptidase [Bryobacteraceae bacterium]|nr:M56 family metallopeptidase [Bryobacteraceae bacterium]
MATLWLRNLGFYSVQILLIAAIGAVLLHALRIRISKARLICWQALLAVCLLLPAIEPWQRFNVDSSVQITTGAFTPVQRSRGFGFIHIPPANIILLALGAGAAIRFGMLALGFVRLRRYRGDSRVVPDAFCDLQRRLGAHADVHVSAETPGPVTFGFLRPVILLPESCLQDESVACHELLHVRRRDWLFTVIEECVLATFWYHPAMWWLVAQIQLAREEAVDREAVTILNSRERYLQSLLALATAKVGLDLVPASPFLRRRHLQKRVASLLKEVSMSRLRLSWSLATFVAALALAGWLGVRSFPLQAAPQEKLDASGVSVDQSGLTLLHRVPVAYPREAKEKGIEGDILVELNLAATGAVSDARILTGPEELRKAVLESVLEWHYANDAQLPTKTQVTIKFRLTQATPAVASPMPSVDGTTTVKQIIVQVPESLKQKIANRISLREGDPITQTSISDLVAAVREVDEHLTVRAEGGVITIVLGSSMPPQRIRVGGNVQQANLIQKVQPHYPLQAKQEHVQGKVEFRVLIGKDGYVQNLELISGKPVLVEAAKEAVAQWVYKPTLLNGQPVEVLTQVDVNFTLTQ